VIREDTPCRSISRRPGEASHPNVGLLDKLYTSIMTGDADSTAACYAPDAYFEDIAFRLKTRKDIRDMWRMVCEAKPQVSFNQLVADDTSGSGHWVARYTFRETNLPVVNDIVSEFTFENGLIRRHVDHCNPLRWGLQAYGFPKGLVAGLLGSYRRKKAQEKLESFVRRTAA
jgi:ketosteroid isomerase-like protein